LSLNNPKSLKKVKVKAPKEKKKQRFKVSKQNEVFKSGFTKRLSLQSDKRRSQIAANKKTSIMVGKTIVHLDSVKPRRFASRCCC